MILNLCDRFSIDINLYLNVADHKPDYSQDYIKPDPTTVRVIVDDIKMKLLERFIKSLVSCSRSGLLKQIESLTPVITPIPSKPKSHDDKQALRSFAQVSVITSNI